MDSLPKAVLSTDDVGETAAGLQARGFRIHRVFPADDPREIELVGHGLRVAVERRGYLAPPKVEPAVHVCRGGTWGSGRAGMQYRDLLPGVYGGQFIASHIRVPGAGPIADWVHYHQVGWQLIFVHRGWVRVVYEDQGPSFVMHAGDAVLQPPTIRHRVLSSGDDLEVIELASPAEHETLSDMELALPNAEVARRDWKGQAFVWSRAAERTDGEELGLEQASGRVALFEGTARTATAIAQSKVRLLALERADLLSLMEEMPGIAVVLLQTLSRRVRDLTDRLMV